MTSDGAKALPSIVECALNNCPCVVHAPEDGWKVARKLAEELGRRTPDPATVRVLEAAKAVVQNDKTNPRYWLLVAELHKAVEALAGREKNNGNP